jgi:hypothetical protein
MNSRRRFLLLALAGASMSAAAQTVSRSGRIPKIGYLVLQSI